MDKHSAIGKTKKDLPAWKFFLAKACISGLLAFMITEATVLAQPFDRTTAPPIATPEAFFMPEYQTTTLENGLTIYYLEDGTRPLLFASFLLRGGALGEHKAGISSFMMALLKRGTKSYSAMEFASATDGMGATFRASCGWDSASVSFTVLGKYVPTALQLAAEAMLQPIFSDEEINRARSLRLASLEQQCADPSYLAGLAYSRVAFGSHPYSTPPNGTTEDVRSYSREDCLRAYNEMLQPSKTVLIAGGSVPFADFTELVKALFGTWENTNVQRDIPSAPRLPKQTTIGFIEKRDASQTEIIIGFPIPGFEHPDYAAAEFINSAFGGSFSSRLSKNIREDKGYTYGISSFFDTRRDVSMLVIQLSVGNDVTAAALKEIFNELQLLSSAPLSAEEITLFKQYIPGSVPLRSETPRQLASLLATIAVYDLPLDFYTKLYSSIGTFTAESLFDVQQKHFNPPAVFIGLSGKPEVIKKATQSLGELREFDIQGNPVKK